MQIALLVAYPLLVFLASTQASSAIAGIALGILVVGVLYRPLRQGNRKVLLITAVMWAGSAAAVYLQISLLLMKLPAIFFPLVLLAVFAGSLLPGREAIVTSIGESARGPLSPAMRVYTRRVTQLWSTLFALMVVLGFLPFLMPHLSQLMRAVGFVLYPLTGAVFFGEFYLRKWLFPEHDHPSFFEYIKIVTSAGVVRPSIDRSFHE